MEDTERGRAEGEAGSMQGARSGTQSRIPGSHPEPKADAQPLRHPGVPRSSLSKGVFKNLIGSKDACKELLRNCLGQLVTLELTLS